MIEPKPLSNQRIAEIATYIQYRLHDTGGAEFDQMLAEQEDLLGDALYWRMRCEALETRSVSDSAVGNFKLAQDGHE